MQRLLRTATMGLFALAFAAIGFATPLTVSSHPFSVDSGGRFVGYLNNNSSALIDLYCIDFINSVGAQPVTYDANVSTMADLSKTRYGTTAQGSFLNQTAPNAISLGDAANRYLLVGWLISQYDLSSGANTGSKDIGIQNAIWDILNVTGPQQVDGAYSTWINNAVNWKAGASSQQIATLSSEIRIYTSSDVASLGLPGRYSTGRQEFMNLVPEPGSIALASIGLSLIGAGALRRRRKQAQNN